MLALRYEDGMIALVSGLESILGDTGRDGFPAGTKLAELESKKPGGYSCSLRLFDEAKAAWINPLLLVQLPRDTTPPRLESLALRRGRAAFELPLPPKGRLSLPQATYSVFIKAVEPARSSFSSGIFRYRILLDGQIIMDKKMDSALSTRNGLSFADLVPPTSSSIDEKGRIGLGNLDIPRGQHLLEVSVFDFFGNLSQASWRLTVD
jgi:hypothetical protein